MSRPLSLTSRVTCFTFSMIVAALKEFSKCKTYFFVQGKRRRQPLRRSSYPKDLVLADRIMQKCLPVPIHEANRWTWSLFGGDVLRKSRWVSLIVGFASRKPWNKLDEKAETHPAFRSFKRSTNVSKSIELGESKSYSLLCAKICCSGLKTL